MLKDEILKNINKLKTKRIKSTKLTRQTFDTGHKTKLTTWKSNNNKL
jgi:hypothetical protein